MAKYYYNGVLLPELPADVLAQYPYVWIGCSNGTYYFYAAFQKWWYKPAAASEYSTFSIGTQLVIYKAPQDEWVYVNKIGSGDFVIANYTNLWSSHDIPNGSATATEIYFYGSDPVPEHSEPSTPSEPTTPSAEAMYAIYGHELTAVADAIRRKTGKVDSLTLAQMPVEIDGLNGGSGGDVIVEELPSAEDNLFGVNNVSTEVGFSINQGKSCSNTTNSSSYYESTTYSANETFAILGVRVFCGRYTSNLSIYLWNADGELVGQVDGLTIEEDGYTDAYFDTHVNVGVGEEFTLSTSSHAKCSYISTGYVTLSNKITYQRANEGYQNPPTTWSVTNIRGAIAPIIAPVQEELPDNYKIARTTMDDIALEMQRITNTANKMNIAQIQSGLESVVLQEKTITPSTEPQEIVPDSGYYGLYKVTVEAMTDSGSSGSSIDEVFHSASATGCIPDYDHGNAISAFTATIMTNITSSASGTLN